jgi:hypothetical protein
LRRLQHGIRLQRSPTHRADLPRRRQLR